MLCCLIKKPNGNTTRQSGSFSLGAAKSIFILFILNLIPNIRLRLYAAAITIARTEKSHCIRREQLPSAFEHNFLKETSDIQTNDLLPTASVKTRRNILETSASHAGAVSLLLSTSGNPSHAETTSSVVKTRNANRGQILPYLQVNKAGPFFSAPLRIPRVGYSLYKTSPDQVEDGVQVALQAGVRHFDVATQYQTNRLVGNVLQEYIKTGLGIPNVPSSSQARRKEIFLTHKLSNAEQSTDPTTIQEKVLAAQEDLFGPRTSSSYFNEKILDMVMIHSPLTDKGRRLATYRTLTDLQKKSRISAIGVCNYGINPLQEIIDSGYPPPSVIQLVLSPFNQHIDVSQWARQYNCLISCSAWSKLSSTVGPVAGWTVLADLAKRKGMTNAQILIRWAVQRGYLCVPRSNAKFKIERQNIYENSWNAVSTFSFTDEEMSILNSLDEKYPVGKLGITDGWNAEQIEDFNWDPTTSI